MCGKFGGFVGKGMCMAFKMKMEGIEGDGECLNWFLREEKVFGGVRPLFQMRGGLKIEGRVIEK